MPPGRFEYIQLAKYPHLKPEDVLTWQAFMRDHPREYERVDYDFALGDVPEATLTAIEQGVAGAERLNQYKVDVIGYRADRVDIIELKGKATISAMGQILAYQNLYKREIRPTVATRAVIIASDSTPDLARLCEENGVVLIVV